MLVIADALLVLLLLLARLSAEGPKPTVSCLKAGLVLGFGVPYFNTFFLKRNHYEICFQGNPKPEGPKLSPKTP